MKTVKILVLALVLGFLGYMAYAITLKYSEGEAMKKRISTLPSFRLERMNGGFFTEGDLTNSPLILSYFNSSCTFCRTEAREIQKQMEKFSGIQLLFVSMEDKIQIEHFAKEFGLYEKANCVFLRDHNMEFSWIFGVSTVPATYLYNKDRQLIKVYKGAVKVRSMLEAIQEKPGFK